MAQAAGWFPDPRRDPVGEPVPDSWRWWDGDRWTAWLSDRPDAPPPAEDVPSESPAEPATPPDSKPVRVPVAVAITVAVLAFALLAVGATVSATDSETVSGPPMDPPTPATTATVTYDRQTRMITVGELSMTMPGSPWSCFDTPKSIKGYFTRGFVCSVVTDDATEGGVKNYGNVVIGVLVDDLLGSDLQDTAYQVRTRVKDRLFGQRTTLSDETRPSTTLGPADRVAVTRARLNYRVSDRSSRYDVIDVLTVQLRTGQTAGIILNLPNDVSAKQRGPLSAAYDSIAVS